MALVSLDKPIPRWAQFVSRHRALIVPFAFMSLLAVILVPIPPALMDVLIAANISIAVIMLMVTMYMVEPLEFSVFPSLLLGTTLLRLVLNVASTRLILTADASSAEEALNVAGRVISAFGNFVAGGSMFVGVVIFIILVVIQFIVITRGATRISEVAARFTLDAMPGKQMAIDADLNAGIITETEAKERRARISQEADFFGAMDGASKFVRGDAIAGIIITIVNIIGGFAIGSIEKGWGIADTAEVFTKLTIGDGISSQIPSFVIAIAAALVVTRAGSRDSLGGEMTSQLAGRPVALLTTAAFLGFLAMTPLPTMPLLTLAGLLAVIAFLTTRDTRSRAVAKQAKEKAEAAAPAQPPVEDLLKVDTLELEIGYGLVGLVDAKQGGDLLDRISAIRRQIAAELGLVMPPVRIRDNMMLAPNAYRIKIRGNVVDDGDSRPGLLLAMDSGIASGKLDGIQVKEPAFGLDAWWIEPGLKGRAETLNYTVVDPSSVVTTHLAEVVKRHADELLTREEVNNLLTQLKQRSPKLVEDTVPGAISAGDLQKILQSLLRERVPIRDMESVLETIADWSPRTKDVEVLTEYVRNSLRRTISQLYAVPSESGGRNRSMRIVCVTLDPAFEDFVGGYIDRSPTGTSLNIPASTAGAVARQVVKALEPVTASGHAPVVIASPQVRAQIRQILEPYIPNVSVLGYNEVVGGVEVESMGLVTMPEPAGAGAAA